jgi:hypothetical protein
MLVPSYAVAQDTLVPAGDAWYKVVAGIIAIPAAVLGIIVSWNMMQKTRLETRKLELEINDKERAVRKEVSPAEKLALISAPLSDSQRALLIIVRFVLLEVTLRIWNFVPAAVSAIAGMIYLGVLWIFGIGAMTSKPVIAVTIVPSGISFLLSTVYWTIVFGFGWPLFKDTCSFLNIPVKNLLDLPRIGHYRSGPKNVKGVPPRRATGKSTSRRGLRAPGKETN